MYRTRAFIIRITTSFHYVIIYLIFFSLIFLFSTLFLSFASFHRVCALAYSTVSETERVKLRRKSVRLNNHP